MADNESYATRVSRQIDEMMRKKALENAQARAAKQAQQEAEAAERQKQAQTQTQTQPQETRSTIEQIRADRQAPVNAPDY